MTDYITLYDSTLRDGSQARGIDFTLPDKIAIAKALDDFGIDYIEGGFVGSNKRDAEFFANPPKLNTSKLTAFGMTRRAGVKVSDDVSLAALVDSGVSQVCIVGKAWDFHIEQALEISFAENRKMIADSISYLKDKGLEVLFDAEHFFDGFKHNRAVAMDMVKAAADAGASWVVLCDTNGGSQPNQIEEIVGEVTQVISGDRLGIHCHNDTEQAVANSLAAVRAGVRQVQGTLGGIGERCGNANLISIIPNLMLKMGFDTGVSLEKLKELTKFSKIVDDRLNRASNKHAPFVGESAFAHKGGLHVSAMEKNTASYEHISPESVGNERIILVSDKAGKSNILSSLKSMGLAEKAESDEITALVGLVKERESVGYAYEDAAASFEIMARRRLKNQSIPDFFTLESFRVVDERRYNSNAELVTVSEATIKLKIGDERVMTIGEGNGPVNALDSALRQALIKHYPTLKDMQLSDYKVRILTPQAGTGALTRVLIETKDTCGEVWNTIGVSENIIDASFNALNDAILYKLLKNV